MSGIRHDGVHVLADAGTHWRHDPVEQASAACEGGARVVQLRAKDSADTRALDWGREIRRLTRAAGVCFIVNDRFDLALCLEADGVHLGQDDLPPRALTDDARARLGVGRSTHDLEQARSALAEACDYLAYGPVFETGSKETGYGSRGIEGLRAVVKLAGERPVVAIGGIDAERARLAAAAGADGVAVISVVAAARDPVAATRRLVAGFAAGVAERA